MELSWVQIGMFWGTVGLVLVSVFTALTSYFLLRSTLDPHVVVYARNDVDRPTIITIVIENTGHGVAHDVRFDLSSPIPSRAFGMTANAAALREMTEGPLIDGIPVLGPSDSRIITWGQYPALRRALDQKAIKVIAHYRSKHRFPWDPTDHSTESKLEVASFAGTDASMKPVQRGAKNLEVMAGAMRDLASGRSVIRVEVESPDVEDPTAASDSEESER